MGTKCMTGIRVCFDIKFIYKKVHGGEQGIMATPHGTGVTLRLWRVLQQLWDRSMIVIIVPLQNHKLFPPVLLEIF